MSHSPAFYFSYFSCSPFSQKVLSIVVKKGAKLWVINGSKNKEIFKLEREMSASLRLFNRSLFIYMAGKTPWNLQWSTVNLALQWSGKDLNSWASQKIFLEQHHTELHLYWVSCNCIRYVCTSHMPIGTVKLLWKFFQWRLCRECLEDCAITILDLSPLSLTYPILRSSIRLWIFQRKAPKY